MLGHSRSLLVLLAIPLLTFVIIAATGLCRWPPPGKN